MGANKLTTETVQQPPRHPWAIIFFFFFLVWAFGWVIGPYIIDHNATYSQIVKVVQEQDINSSAYSYQDSVGSYDGEYYLRDSFELAGRDDYGPTLPFFAGMALCFIILGLGWRYIL